MNRPHARIVAALMLASALSAGCGARLEPDERLVAIGAANDQPATGSGGTAVVGGAAPGEVAPGVPAAGEQGNGPAAGGAEGTAPEVAGAGAGTDTASGDGGGAAPAAPGAAPAGQAPDTKVPAGAPVPAGTTDTRKAPAGGNGGATDKGVTATSITIANISDVGGAVPGLFEDAQNAVKAYVAYFNATEGTIYGRKLKYLPLDSRIDAGASRSAWLQACADAFAGVGSISAFDQGGAPVIKQCGIPDISGIKTTNEAKAVANSFPIDAAGQPGERSMSSYGWIAEAFPEAKKKAAYLFNDGEVTRQTSSQDMKATAEKFGFNWVYSQGIDISETNYAPFALKIKQSGAQYVTMTGAYTQTAKLAQAMAQQGYKPQVYAPTVTAYDPRFLQLAQGSAEGAYIGVTSALREEIDQQPELKLYAQWLQQVDPGASTTSLGAYAWSAAKLFVQLAKEAGPELTREKMLQQLKGVTKYNAGGLIPAQEVGSKKVDDCVQFVQVKNGKFVRVHPSKGYRCGDGVVNVRK